jgi:hypothetical protein
MAKATTVSSVKSKCETIESVKRAFQIDVAGPGIIANQMFHARTRKVFLQQNCCRQTQVSLMHLGGARPKATGKNRALVSNGCETFAARALAIRKKGA